MVYIYLFTLEQYNLLELVFSFPECTGILINAMSTAASNLGLLCVFPALAVLFCYDILH